MEPHARYRMRQAKMVIAVRLWALMVAAGGLHLITTKVAAAPDDPPYKALFVIGDSYADTGNHDPHANKTTLINSAWRIPYGRTYPGCPSGRFSDGFVLTDYMSLLLGQPSAPIPFQQLANYSQPSLTRPSSAHTMRSVDLSTGINFAFGGSGVFKTYGPQYPTTTTQIKQLKRIVNAKIYSKETINQSLLLYVVSGNDYNAFLKKNGSIIDIPEVITNVSIQIAKDLKSLTEIGFKKIIATNLPPTGCLPDITIDNNFTSCVAYDNTLSNLHNLYLNESMNNLQLSGPTKCFVLDNYMAFSNIFNSPKSFGFQNPYQPCCMPMSPQYGCSDVDEKGQQMFTVCRNLSESFFWDSFHPTHAGWGKVLALLKESIQTFVGL